MDTAITTGWPSEAFQATFLDVSVATDFSGAGLVVCANAASTRGHTLGCPFVHLSLSVVCFLRDYEDQPPSWAGQDCGQYGQQRWAEFSHICTLPPSIAGRTALTHLWAGLQPACRSQRPDLDAQLM
eukprot:1506622-Amphidinium_carterae.1